jgi:hypothetical protein
MFDRFAEIGVHADLAAARDVAGAPDGGEQHDRRRRERFIALDLTRECEAVDLGHLAVGDQDVKAAGAACGLAQNRERMPGVGHHRGRHTPAGEHLVEDAAIGGVVVNDQHT